MLNNLIFKDIANDTMLNIAILYREASIILLMIIYVIIGIVLYIIENFNHEENKFPIYFSKKAESVLDIIFVLFPTLIVIYLIIPAIGFIYNTEYTMSQIETLFNVLIIGHQWYWSYEYNINICNDYTLNLLGNEFIHEKLSFDSLIDMNATEARLLTVDKRLILPSNTFINLMITSEDVIHSWALPQFGIKIDATPGRIAEYVFYANFNGIYYGQCSELCGVNHGFMPINVETVSYLEFLDFLLISLNFNPSMILLKNFKSWLIEYNFENEDKNENENNILLYMYKIKEEIKKIEEEEIVKIEEENKEEEKEIRIEEENKEEEKEIKIEEENKEEEIIKIKEENKEEEKEIKIEEENKEEEIVKIEEENKEEKEIIKEEENKEEEIKIEEEKEIEI